MRKILAINYDKCTGCRTCELDCVFFHEKMFNPSRARIRALRIEAEGLYMPVVCQQCEDALCTLVCPVNAFYRAKKTGAVLIKHDVCLGCRICMAACPFGAITFDEFSGKMLKCDLCDGDPVCVKHCTSEAIKYTSCVEASLDKMHAAICKPLGVGRKGASEMKLDRKIG